MTAFLTPPNSEPMQIGKASVAGLLTSPRCSFIAQAINGTLNSAIAPDWCALPGARRCAVTIGFGFRKWDPVTRRSLRISGPAKVKAAHLTTNSFARTLADMNQAI